jgi:hypothetical protein
MNFTAVGVGKVGIGERHDTQRSDCQQNNIQHNDIRQNDFQCSTHHSIMGLLSIIMYNVIPMSVTVLNVVAPL